MLNDEYLKIAYVFNRTLSIALYYLNRSTDDVKALKINDASLLILLYNIYKDQPFFYLKLKEHITNREIQRLIERNFVLKYKSRKGYIINPAVLDCLETQSKYINERFNKPKYKKFLESKNNTI